MKYKKYPSYKDSGIEWLGEIPGHWKDINSLKRGLNLLTDFESNGSFADVKANVTLDSEDKYAWYLRATDLENKRAKNIRTCDKKSYDFLKKTSLFGKELLVSKRGEVGKIYITPEIKGKATLAPNLYLLRTNHKLDSKFAYYWFLSTYGMPQLLLANKSTTIGALYKDDVKDTKIVYPNFKEQQQIASFLDNATSKIDTLIEKQTKLIEILKEKRQAVISHAVTKGINPDVKMKDSGVEWLGEIPEHWEVGLLSTLFDNNSNKNKGMKNNNLLSLSYGKIINKDIETSFGLLPESFESYQIVKPGYIILRLTDLQNDKKSLRTGLVTQEGIITSAYVGLKKKSKSVGNEKFIHYYLHTFDIYKGFYGMGSGVRQSLNFDELKKLRFVLPPKDEQDYIVNYIDDKTSKMDKLIEKANKSIELLKEKRTALISAAVTGKIDVRK